MARRGTYPAICYAGTESVKLRYINYAINGRDVVIMNRTGTCQRAKQLGTKPEPVNTELPPGRHIVLIREFRRYPGRTVSGRSNIARF